MRKSFVSTALFCTLFLSVAAFHGSAARDRSQAKESITIAQLNRHYNVLGIIDETVGKVVKIEAALEEIKEKPGKYLAVKSIDGKRREIMIPTHLVEGSLPKTKPGDRFAFTAKSSIELGQAVDGRQTVVSRLVVVDDRQRGQVSDAEARQIREAKLQAQTESSTAIRNEVKELRKDLLNARLTANKQFKQVVSLSNEITKLRSELKRLKK